MTVNRIALAAALHLWGLGANVTSICAGDKEPAHDWNSKRAPWATKRQPQDVVTSLPWYAKRRVVNGREYQPTDKIGIISGITDWRVIDVDARQVNGEKVPVPTEVRAALLGALGLPLDYEWCGRSISGTGLHIHVTAAGELPERWRAASKRDSRGVIIFDPLPAYADAFDHIELRWQHCQTTLPSFTGYNGHLPDQAPCAVPLDALAQALEAIAAPRQRVKPPVAAQRQPDSRRRTERNDVIGAFNAHYRAGDILERNGYTPVSDGWAHPRSSQPDQAGVKLEADDRVRSYSANDPLNDGSHSHDAFSAFCILEHSGDTSAAVKAAAAELGMSAAPATKTRKKKALAALAEAERAESDAESDGGLLDERPTSERLLGRLHKWGYRFSMNLMSDQLLVNGEPLTDTVEAEIRTRLRDAGLWGMIDAARDAYRVEAARNAFHPVKDYLNGLRWDGVDRIEALAAALQHEMPAIEYDDGQAADPAVVYVQRWLAGAAGKALAGEQNMMLVLSGPHGIGKSELARWLCSPLPMLFSEDHIDPTDKDIVRRLMTCWIWEVGELDATTRRADVAALKAFLTRREVRTRHPYDKHDTVKPALASFIGTVNPSHGGFLAEPDDRRFLVLNLAGIDWSYRDLDVHQLWAQAVALFRSGALGRLEAAERRYQIAANEQHRLPSLLAALIEREYFITGDSAHFITSIEVAAHLLSKGARLPNSDKGASMEIAAAMQALRVAQGRRDGSRGPRGYFGLVPRATSRGGDDDV